MNSCRRSGRVRVPGHCRENWSCELLISGASVRDWQRAASVAFATHNTAEGLSAYREHGAIRVAQSGDEARAEIVRGIIWQIGMPELRARALPWRTGAQMYGH